MQKKFIMNIKVVALKPDGDLTFLLERHQMFNCCYIQYLHNGSKKYCRNHEINWDSIRLLTDDEIDIYTHYINTELKVERLKEIYEEHVTEIECKLKDKLYIGFKIVSLKNGNPVIILNQYMYFLCGYCYIQNIITGVKDYCRYKDVDWDSTRSSTKEELLEFYDNIKENIKINLILTRPNGDLAVILKRYYYITYIQYIKNGSKKYIKNKQIDWGSIRIPEKNELRSMFDLHIIKL
jgi:hypothetical protein